MVLVVVDLVSAAIFESLLLAVEVLLVAELLLVVDELLSAVGKLVVEI